MSSLCLEDAGIEPATSRMRSERSTNWAKPPGHAPAGNRTRGPTMATLDFTTKPLALSTWTSELAKLSKIIHYIHIYFLSYFNYNYSRGYNLFNSTFDSHFQTLHVIIRQTLTQSFTHFILHPLHSKNKMTSHHTHSHPRKYIIDFTSCVILLWWPNNNDPCYHQNISTLDIFIAWH